MTASLFRPRTLLAGLSLSAALGLSACGGGDTTLMDGKIQAGQIVGGGTVQMTNVQPVGGFLPEPGLLQPGGNGRAALFYVNQNVDPSRYGKIILEPVEVWTAPGSDLARLPLNQRQAAANTFYSKLFNAMKQSCVMTRSPGPGVLRMKFALVDAKLPNAAINTVATYTPYASTAYGVASFTLNGGVGYFAGTATVEGFAKDSRSGLVVWQAVDKRGGTTSLAENTMDTWLDVHHAFDAWAKQITQRLVSVGICQR